jgi:hypothetical protein
MAGRLMRRSLAMLWSRSEFNSLSFVRFLGDWV